MNALNLALFHWINAGNQPTQGVLVVARGFALWAAWLSAGILALALWRRRGERAYLFAVAATAGVTSLVSHGIAMLLNVPRPFVQGLSPAYITHAASGSLPSTHAAVMSMVALAFLLRPGLRALGVVLLALAAATGWARIYVGVHFPIDIAAGFVLGSAMACALALAFRIFHFFALRAGRASGQGPADRSLWRPS
ncbi:phosphatase PAP2 family protein [Variovorax sp. EL159]|uniref:phosphatase PAP2 family protein n=1 Tax=Variovorax sp. EL159 TaxID=1566270 RepID=UPI0008827EF8|nr:phosphatase PAP2 family protein [Variovorax sp. EL159]SCX73325.1 undecaprenyl-diphosphatase [Variovorax sp. EL159]